MSRFIALLRGVNVGKSNRVSMADFKEMLQRLGFTQVTTLLNSGNAVFTGSGHSAAKHAVAIANALAESQGVNVLVVVKSADELSAAVSANPILVPETDHSRFLVAFASEPAALKGLEALQSLAQGSERLVIGQHAAYLHCAAGVLESKVAAALLGNAGRSLTTRNWATTLKLRSLSCVSAA
jgi:uncharacterized protein (DUF1697 family)